MNTIYRIVWNVAAGKWVVASELARGRKKAATPSVLAAISLVMLMGGVSAGAANATTTVVGDNATASCGTPTAGAILNPLYVAPNQICGTAIGSGAQGVQGGTAIGDSAITSGFYGVALGAYSSAASHATAVGPSALATGSDSFAGGVNATSSGGFSVALGSTSVASGYLSLALGPNSSATSQSGIAIGNGAVVAGTTSGITAIGFGAKANNGSIVGAWSATAIGTHALANGDGATAFGDSASASADQTSAYGRNAKATMDGATAFGAGTNVAASAGTAIGQGAMVQAAATNAVAVGAGSVANRINTVSIGAVGSERNIVNVAAGVADTDAVNVSQLKPAIAALGGGAAIDPTTGVVTGPTYHVAGGTQANVGDALGALDGGLTTANGKIVNIDARTTTNEGNIAGLKNGTLGLVQQAAAGNDLTVGAATNGTGVNFADSTGASRVLRGVSAGVANTDGVNVSQLKPAVAALGGGAAINPATGAVTGPTYNVAGGTQANVGDALDALDGGLTTAQGDIVSLGTRTTVNEGDISRLKNGTLGLVQQAAAGDDLTVGATTDGTGVNFVDSTGASRSLRGVSAGVADTDAVNMSQLNTTNGNVTTLGNRVTQNTNDITNLQAGVQASQRYLKANGNNDGSDDAVASGALSLAVGSRAAATDMWSMAVGTSAKASGYGSTALGQNAVASGEGSVALGEGSLADRDNVVSVGYGSGGNGQRAIINVGNGTQNTDAVTVQQLKPAIASLGGGATFNTSNGVVTGPTYNVAGGTQTNVGDALDALNGGLTDTKNRVSVNEGDITNLYNQIGSGTVGLVQQIDPSGMVSVAGATGGNVVSFTGTDGDRQLQGVAAGTLGNDAVNLAQMNQALAGVSAGDTRYFKADGLNDGTDDAVVTGTGSVAIGANASATSAGSNAVALGQGSIADRANTVSVGSAVQQRQITNVADGTEDTDAVNVRQLKASGLVGSDGSALDAVVYDAGSSRGSVTFGGIAGTRLSNVMAGAINPFSTDAINGSQLWNVQDQIDRLGDRVGSIEAGGALVPIGDAPMPATGEGRDPGFASSGSTPATASGTDSVAAGSGSQATGANSTAIGSGSQASADNSVALGSGSVADRANTVSVGSADNERQITNVAAGTQRTDAANWGQVQDAMATANRYTDDRFDTVNKRIGDVQRQANRGIAASAALINVTPYIPGKTVLNAGVANYRGESAMGVGVSRWNDTGRVNLNAGMSAAAGDSPIFRVGVGIVLGD